MMRKNRTSLLLGGTAAIITAVTGLAIGFSRAAETASAAAPKVNHLLFTTSEHCLACHSKVYAPSGQDISIGYNWRASIMANSGRDPYWQAAVRRETMDHPMEKAEIEDTCTTCHMPMQRFQAHAEGREGQALAYFDAIHSGQANVEPEMILEEAANPMANLAADGVSCTLCHQIRQDNFGQTSSYTGGFVIDTAKPDEERQIFGPFDVNDGRTRVMHSVTGFIPTKADHIRDARLCEGCHTLITKAFDDKGNFEGNFPEQVPFQEWEHSAYQATNTCQSCHMPQVPGEAPITSVQASQHEGVSRHIFDGGNAFLLRILADHAKELGVVAPPAELIENAERTEAQLATNTASVTVARPHMNAGRFEFAVTVTNKTGHKFPTAYPSRRAWLHVTVKDAHGLTVFESGASRPDGSVVGNDNDMDALKFEPHYERITEPDQVQIYESILGDYNDRVTTGLISTTHYLKDNRLLPRGFDKNTASDLIKVVGSAHDDADFTGGSDTVDYSIAVPAGGGGPYSVTADLDYESIGYRWANNLRNYNAPEPNRFVAYYTENQSRAVKPVAHATATGG